MSTSQQMKWQACWESEGNTCSRQSVGLESRKRGGCLSSLEFSIRGTMEFVVVTFLLLIIIIAVLFFLAL